MDPLTEDPEVKLVQQKIIFKLRPKESNNNTKDKPIIKDETFVSKESSLLDPTTTTEYKSYPERWWLLSTVVILNLANYRWDFQKSWQDFKILVKYSRKRSMLRIKLSHLAISSYDKPYVQNLKTLSKQKIPLTFLNLYLREYYQNTFLKS